MYKETKHIELKTKLWGLYKHVYLTISTKHIVIEVVVYTRNREKQ